MTVPGGIDHRNEESGRLFTRALVFIFWLITVLFLGFVEWLIFVGLAINGNGCPSSGFDIFGPTRTGGAASAGALGTASVIGLSLCLAAGAIALRLGGRRGSVMFGFVVVYGVSLAVFWPIASLIWGPRQCA
jgi:hypothetical protein